MAAYSNPYGDLARVNVRGPSADERQRGNRASQQANVLRFLSGVAPAAGSVIGMGAGALVGGPAGAALGGALGGGAGQLLGGLGNGQADEMTRPFEESDLKRRRQMEIAERFLRGS